MRKIHLQRQGVSKSFRYRDPTGSFSLEVQRWQDEDQYTARLFWPNDKRVERSKQGQTAWSYPKQDHGEGKQVQRGSLANIKREASRAIHRLMGVEVEFADEVEAYMHYNAAELKIWPYLASDFYFACAVYEPCSNTIRNLPSNYCLVSFDGYCGEPGPCFDVDAAATKYQDICKEAYAEYVKDHNQRQGEQDAKEWLAWLISEWIKDRIPGEKPHMIKSMSRRRS